MPFVRVSTSTGNINFHYIISIPECANAESLDENLPVLLFFHGMGLPTVFHSQFGDPLLRKFNLVTFHLKFHGETTSDAVPDRYGAEEAAEDALALMEALQLPPCHFVTMDIGSMIEMQIAVIHHEKALSLFIMSRLCSEELPEVYQARKELHDLWFSGIPHAPQDVVIGYTHICLAVTCQILLNCMNFKLFDYSASIHFQTWDMNHSAEYSLATYHFFIKCKPYSQETLSRIACPVRLLQGGNNIVYTESYTQRFVHDLKQADVDVSWHTVLNALHYLCVEHGPE
ncbi:hypothetical protein GYMLUDRAFT_177371 [Collybiopsis luxurians FD-317 M1]|uniref:AB hydrolase-1 domain-containing protein n=1 Tax=Collybiopsis luxurians FD-317 M1 TaxID=944289 RepID=A0A0D0BHV4_9AGAR|nr:hypothetical protein GYMLUDRAFT_177371 [Collybiopsis luxurians FD-317 M1]